ncbi:urease accessory protein UreD [Bradyrhizobium sp.]|uniref:urease accessory protein UreD n=1 Tax=Bradyrhizobium sp. TaxID=376 RepID=UPI003C3C91ED
MRFQPLSSSRSDPGRDVEAYLAVDLAGGRTTLRRQLVGYPLHVTRGFYLDAGRPDLLTLYLQSASGGLYAGDRLKLDVSVGANAAFHLTAQAATVVHDGRASGSRQRQSLHVAGGAFCAIASDPYVLFPGADLALETMAIVAEDAVLFLADGFAVHDPGHSGSAFAQFSSRQRILRPDGRLLLQDFGRLRGDELRNGSLGPLAAAATILVIAPPDRLPAMAVMELSADRLGCLAGASLAPNGAGLVMRILAPDGGTLARALEAAFHVAGRAALGTELARRRK